MDTGKGWLMSITKVFLSTWLVRASVMMNSLWGMLMVDRFYTFVHSLIFIYMSLSQILSLMSQPLCISDQLVTAYKSLYNFLPPKVVSLLYHTVLCPLGTFSFTTIFFKTTLRGYPEWSSNSVPVHIQLTSTYQAN